MQDFDQSQASQQLAGMRFDNRRSHVVSWPTDKQPEVAFASNRREARRSFLEDYGRRIARGEDTTVQILVDASE